MKYIELSGKNGKGLRSIVDEIDFEYLTKYRWYLSNDGYVKRSCKAQETRMHRVIMSAPEDKFVDHINGNTLDNRRENLRLCTNQQNQWNSAPIENTSSQYKGVTKRNNAYDAYININNYKKYLGRFSSEIAAANFYNHNARRLYGEFARLNVCEFMTEDDCLIFRKTVKKTSQYKGIHWSKKMNKWEGNLRINGKQKFLGYFSSEQEAVQKRNDMVIELGLDCSMIQNINGN